MDSSFSTNVHSFLFKKRNESVEWLRHEWLNVTTQEYHHIDLAISSVVLDLTIIAKR